MPVRLDLIRNWPELAEAANYQPRTLARNCGVSLRRLERFFEKNFHMSPHDWLNQQRQRKATELIVTGQSVKEVTHRLGFKQVSHFSCEFKRAHGVSPTEFRPPESGFVARR